MEVETDLWQTETHTRGVTELTTVSHCVSFMTQLLTAVKICLIPILSRRRVEYVTSAQWIDLLGIEINIEVIGPKMR